jgi:nitroreductase
MLEAIQNRRSIRFYRDTYVTDEQIAEILKAGFCAPSAHNRCQWHVVVIRDQETKEKLSAVHNWAKIVIKAPVVMVVCVERTGFDHFWIEDGSAFTENMLVQATDMGLSTCWVGVQGLADGEFNAEAIVRDALDLPEQMGVVNMVTLGYGARFPKPREPKIPDGRLHYGKFGNYNP